MNKLLKYINKYIKYIILYIIGKMNSFFLINNIEKKNINFYCNYCKKNINNKIIFCIHDKQFCTINCRILFLGNLI